MSRGRSFVAGHSAGFTLVELMVALLLGLVVIGATISTMLANRQTYRSSDAMSQVQEELRTAFELMSRDLREAGATFCGNSKVANVLNNAGSTSAEWWEDWEGLQGYKDDVSTPVVAFGTAAGTRVNGTDAVKIMRVKDIGVTVVEHKTSESPPNFEINKATSEIGSGDVLMVCGPDHGTLFQATSYDSNVTVAHATGGSTTPGNCSTGLGYPTTCTTSGNPYTYGANSSIGKLAAVVWFIGNNGRAEDGGRSLYRASLNGTTTQIEEMVAGITNLQLQYRRSGENIFEDTPSNWSNVNAVKVTLSIQSLTKNVSTESTNDGRLSPADDVSYVVALMNRLQ